MKKSTKIISIAAAILLTVSLIAVGVYAHTFRDVSEYDTAITTLNTLEVIVGFNDYEFKPNENITRWQMALLITKLVTGDTDGNNWISPQGRTFTFTDITNAAHYGGSIAYAASNGIIIGRNETTFDPTAGIILQDAATMLIRALGYPRANYDINYPNSYINKAAELKLFDGLSNNIGYTSTLTRGQTAQLLYNALYAEKNNGSTIASDVFKYVDKTVVIAATDTQRIDSGVAYTSSPNRVTLCELNPNGTVGGVLTTQTISALGISNPNELIGASYHMVALDNYSTILEFESNKRVDMSYKTNSIFVTGSNSNSITIDGVSYKVVTKYSQPLVSAVRPQERELIVYGWGEMHTQGQPLTAGEMFGTTSYYKMTGYDDNEDGTIDRVLYTPYTFSTFEKTSTKITINGVSKKELNVSDTIITGETPVSGNCIIYSYNSQRKVLDIAETYAISTGTISSYNLTNSTIEIYTSSSASSLKAFVLGDPGLYGAQAATVAKPLTTASSSTIYYNTVVKYVTEGSNLLYLEVDNTNSGLGGTGFAAYTDVAIITNVETSNVANGYLRITVYTMSGGSEIMYATQINSQSVVSNYSTVQKGDIIQFSESPVTIPGSTQKTYNIKPFNASPFATLTSSSAYYYYIGCNGTNLGLGYSLSTSGNITYYADVKIDTTTIIYYSVDGLTVQKLSTTNLINGYPTRIDNNFSMYVSYGVSGGTTAKFVYIRPKPSTTTVNDSSSFTHIVYLSPASISEKYTNPSGGGIVFPKGISLFAGEVINQLYLSGDIIDVNHPIPQVPGYYKVAYVNSLWKIVDTLPIKSSLNSLNVSAIYKTSSSSSGQITNFRIATTGSYSYQVDVDGVSYKTNTVYIYGFNPDANYELVKKTASELSSYSNAFSTNSSLIMDGHVFFSGLTTGNIATAITIIMDPLV